MKIKVYRVKESYDYKVDPNKPSGFDNNWKNNSLDTIKIFDDQGYEVFSANCQSVANYNWGDYKSNGSLEYGDTVDGKFKVHCFVAPRAFHGKIHGIINAVDKDGQMIDGYSMQYVNGYQSGRWLIHDRWSFKTNCDTNYAWSAGCFILSSMDLSRFNNVLEEHGVKVGDIINGEVIEV